MFDIEAQGNYAFRHITAVNGLPDNQIEGLFFTPDGRLGIRTTALISLFDGNKYQSLPYNAHHLYYWAYGNIPLCQYIDVQDRVWIKDRSVLRVLDLKSECYIENIDSLVHSFGIKQRLANMFIDDDKHYWFITDDNSLYLYDGDHLNAMPVDDVMDTDYGHVIGLNSAGNYCWMVYSNGYLCCWDIVRKKIIREESLFVGRIKSEERVIIRTLSDGSFWMAWDNGVAYYDETLHQWVELDDLRLDARDMFTALDTDAFGNAWVGTGKSGVYIINKEDFSVSRYPAIPLIDGTSIHNDITNIAINQEKGDVWISFLFQGLAYYHPNINKFSLFNSKTVNGSLPEESIRCMLEDEDGNILLGTLNGLFRFNPETKSIDMSYKELVHKFCYVLYRDSHNRIWVGTMYDGLYCIDKQTVHRYYTPDIDFHVFQREANYNSIRNILESQDGQFWISVTGGVSNFNPKNGHFAMLSARHPELSPYTICQALAEDENGQLIVGSTNGLYYYNPEHDFVWRPEVDAPKDERFIHSNSRYNYICRDSRNLYWFGTQNGLAVVDMVRGDVYHFDSDNGMANSVVKMIVEDKGHNMWVSTANSICKITVTPTNGKYEFDIVAFSQNNGLLSGEYYANSGLVASDGTIYFGGLNGFTAFSPENIVCSQSENHPVLTGLYLFNTLISPGQKYNDRVVLEQSLNYTKRIELDYDENFVAIEFSGLNFANPDQTYYKYRLEGFDNDWNETSFSNTSGKAVYTGLSHGKYTFWVYTANSDKLWGKQAAKLDIIIHPPFWNTIWARILYAILFIVLMVWFIVYMDKRNKRRVWLLQQAEAQKQKEELDQMKFRFFTNISHEFRTPLTLIITPLEAYIKKLKDETERKKLFAIHHNALDLLALVNQLLDFRKLEVKGEELVLLSGDFTDFTRQVYASFQTIADEKQISFQFDSTGNKEVYMYFDRDKVHKIMNNLLSNAFKFTPEGGGVTLKLEQCDNNGRTYIQTKVIDTGIGIPERDLPHVFDRFYQVTDDMSNNKPGSGIGLHLVKEYTVLHEGYVSVESISGAGSIFCVAIPVDLYPDRDIQEPILDKDVEVDSGEMVQSTEVKPLLLIVEDNNEFRYFLREQLNDWYCVIDAANGEDGEQLAIEKNPDLIISDIMMPRVDGMELCRRIKTNLQTSHIPIILLTARTSDESKAMGYEAGADSYISKPFSFDVLLTRIRKLIEQHQKRKEAFHKEIVITPSNITITSLDEKLVQKALECVERNMDNTEYSVEELSADLAMTRATLYRKMQGITGQSPKDFIRSIRLKRAAQLLKDTDLSVSEIADHVGFSTPRYFAKLFKEAFGMLPSQYGGRLNKDDLDEA